MDRSLVSTSRFLSLVLRHKPETIGLTVDAKGWASVDELLSCAAAHGRPISYGLLLRVVRENDKQRFVFSDDHCWIRANQGHSLEVDLELAPQRPPDELFHGTATRFLPSIRQAGLIPGERQHVHLSGDRHTAEKVGARHGKPLVLVIAAARLYEAGQLFYLSENGVWLTSAIAVSYISFPDG
jgi:putative RNA 2'-phosphotransferase